ncbi:MAG: Phosphotransferase enzyme family protein [candidate division WS6 bacterium OLB20]|uniref:Phosphotransferase enzyme family protein n=1 Tax=candidate division WS6 bacterium OLB20 TaxID=1617426 RepID=A0A136LX56_9BACT|nr:MAG: Phosphotransferase enzyme family protein [candidate division WS6 bacterium OLB20]
MQSPKRLLEHFGIEDADLIGAGKESSAYRLKDNRVLKVYGNDASEERVDAEAAFYSVLAAADLPFEVPQVLESGRLEDTLYTIEKFLPGKTFEQLLTDDELLLETAVHELIKAPAHLGRIDLETGDYGHLFPEYAPVPFQAHDWRGFLAGVVKGTVERFSDRFGSVFANTADLTASFTEKLSDLQQAEKSFVHGDFWYPNVLFAQDGSISAVLDLNMELTLRGDWLVDAVSAAVFLRSGAEDLQFDLTRLSSRAFSAAYPDKARQFEVYSLYYAFIFFPYREEDGYLHEWCREQLQALV